MIINELSRNFHIRDCSLKYFRTGNISYFTWCKSPYRLFV